MAEFALLFVTVWGLLRAWRLVRELMGGGLR